MNWSLWPFVVLSVRGDNKSEFSRGMDPTVWNSHNFNYDTFLALESVESIDTRCFPDGPTGCLRLFSRFFLLPGGRWAL